VTEPNVKEDDDVAADGGEMLLVSITALQPELMAAARVNVAIKINL
jgi:hypothetical protein